jgi:hypothetical protein
VSAGTCAATHCNRPVRPGILMCRDHWFEVPGSLRQRVNRTWVRYSDACFTADVEQFHARREAYETARAEAVAAVTP